MKKILLIYFFILTSNIYSQDGWQWVNPYPTANYLTSAQFFNSNTGYVCGTRGEFLKTSDAGISWQYYKIDSLYTDYPKLYFLNQNTGFVYIYDVWKTTNEGVSWMKIYFPEGGGINCINFSDQNTGFALTNETGKVYKTTNGGINWLLNTIPGDIFFSNIKYSGNTAFLCGVKNMLPKLMKSTDLGLNWLEININYNDSLYVDKINITDNQNIILCGQKRYGLPTKILKTTDAGINWNEYQMNNSGYFVTDLEFTDNQNGAAVGYEGYRLYTTNGGINWIENRLTDTSKIIFDLCIAGDNLISVGSFGFIEKTGNSGLNWDRVSRSFTSSHLNSVSFGNVNTGLASGYNGTLLRTTNKGENWTDIIIPGISSCYEVKMVNSQVAFLTAGSKVFKSTNSGINWSIIIDSVNTEFKNISLADNNNIIVDSWNKLYKSSDGGITWNRIWQCITGGPPPIGSCFSIQDIAYPSADRIIMVGSISQSHNPSTAAMMLSSNGGNTFNEIFNTFSGGFGMNTVYMYNENIGFASGGYGYRFKTTDGFNTFIDYGNNLPGNGIVAFYSFSFLDSLNGLAIGDNVYKTINGGVNWSISSAKTIWLKSVCFTGQNNAVAVGLNGSILKMNNFISGISDPVENPVKFLLHQNYPNPFNSSTIISFSLPFSGYTNLILYDVNGKVASEIVNGYKQSGDYEFEYSFNNLSSGVYFLKLTQGNYSQSRKMVMIK